MTRLVLDEWDNEIWFPLFIDKFRTQYVHTDLNNFNYNQVLIINFIYFNFICYLYYYVYLNQHFFFFYVLSIKSKKKKKNPIINVLISILDYFPPIWR